MIMQAMKFGISAAISLFVITNISLAHEKPYYSTVPDIATVMAGYKAKTLCSAVFVSKRDVEDVLNQDLKSFKFPTNIEFEKKKVTVSPGFGRPDQISVFREGLGCTLCNTFTLEHVLAQETGNPIPPPLNPEQEKLLWPEGEAVNTDELPNNVDKEKLKAAVEETFEEPYEGYGLIQGTRAVVVVYKGRIIAESYAFDFSEDMPLIGASMSKNVTSALVGILVGQGKMSVNEPAEVPEWQGKDDPRKNITLDQLLRMSSGLKWLEKYTDLLSDVALMLYLHHDAAGYAISKTPRSDNGWLYSSGDRMIVSRIMRDAIGGSLSQYLSFPRRELFDRIGMRSAVMEPDVSGTLWGVYATARDWARFGLLYFNDGLWAGKRILPEGWVEYSLTPTPKDGKAQYGAYWWLNLGNPKGSGNRMFPKLPSDTYMAMGFQGQNVIVIPSRDLILVRLGASTGRRETWEPQEFATGVLDAIK